MKKLVLLLISITLNSQNINLNNDFLYENLRTKVLNGDLKTKYSFNIRPLNSDEIFDEFKFISKNKSKSVTLKFLGIDFFTEYNSNYPYKRNNGSMLPNRGYQHIISPGIFFNIGPLVRKSDDKIFVTFRISFLSIICLLYGITNYLIKSLIFLI